MTTPWFELEGSAMVAGLSSLITSTVQADAPRIERYKRAISRYEIRALDSLSPWSYQTTLNVQLDDATEMRWAFGRMVVATAVAKIAGTQQPKVHFMTSNADWTRRRRALKADQCVEGLWSTRQEPFADIWDLGACAFRDAAVCDLCGIKVSADVEMGKVLHERVLPEDIFYPHAETRYGSPSTLIQRWNPTSKSVLRAWYPEASDIITRAASTPSSETLRGIWDTRDLGDDCVLPWEVWTLPAGPDAPGKHVLFIDGINEAIIDEDWTRDSFPIVTIHWDRAMRGCFGTSLMDETDGWELAINELWARVLDTLRRTSLNTIVKPKGMVLDNEGETEDANVVEYEGAIPPQVVAATPISPVVIELLREGKQWGFDATGVNEMSATAQKQPGVTANSAMLTLANLQSERFAIAWRNYQQFFVDIARQDLYALRDLYAADKNFAAKWRQGEWLREIRGVDLDLDDQYEIAIQTAPSTKGTPAGRLQAAEDLYAAGILTQDALLSIRTYFDTPGEVARSTGQRGRIDKMIEQWLDATPEQIDSGKTDSGGPLIPIPIPWMRIEDAIAQVAEAYLDADLENVPDWIKELFLAWFDLAQQALEQKAARMAQLQPQAGQPPAPGPQAAVQAAPVPAMTGPQGVAA